MINIFIIFPIFAIFHIAMINNTIYIKYYSLLYSIILFVFNIIVFFMYQANTLYPQFYTVFINIPIAIDSINIYFILLTTYIFPIAILSNWYNIVYKIKTYYILIIILELNIILIFIVQDIFFFYIFYETIIIPLFIIIAYYGSGNITIKSTVYFIFYTLFGSLFMLISIVYLYIIFNSNNILIYYSYYIPNYIQIFIFIGFFLSIAVKTPIFPFHVWLFKAHASSSIGGSIILAAIILKLSSFIIIKYLIPITPFAIIYFYPIIVTLSIVTIIYSSIITIRLIDFKVIIAYTSISHMAIVFISLFSNNIYGIIASFIYNIAHAFTSSSLFIVIGNIIYDRFHTRIINYYSGIVIIMPIVSILFFIFILFNFAIPFSANWIGEFLAIFSVFFYNYYIAFFVTISIIFTNIYSIWFFNRVVFGQINHYFLFNNILNIDITFKEFHLLITLFINNILFGIFSYYWINNIYFYMNNLIF